MISVSLASALLWLAMGTYITAYAASMAWRLSFTAAGLYAIEVSARVPVVVLRNEFLSALQTFFVVPCVIRSTMAFPIDKKRRFVASLMQLAINQSLDLVRVVVDATIGIDKARFVLWLMKIGRSPTTPPIPHTRLSELEYRSSCVSITLQYRSNTTSAANRST